MENIPFTVNYPVLKDGASNKRLGKSALCSLPGLLFQRPIIEVLFNHSLPIMSIDASPTS
jgi:hypothetical protein